jgi:hypothetical protein
MRDTAITTVCETKPERGRFFVGKILRQMSNLQAPGLVPIPLVHGVKFGMRRLIGMKWHTPLRF